MQTKIKPPIVFLFTAFLFAIAANAQTENKYTSSLRLAVQKLSKAEFERDSAAFFSLIDSNIAITRRGETKNVGEDFDGFKKGRTAMFHATSPKITTSFQIEEVKAGSTDPVWAGYDKGTFFYKEESENGKADRRLTGPYYRAWKLVNGQWK